jgi:hypothetical protein
MGRKQRRRGTSACCSLPCPALFNREEERDKERWRKREEKFKLLNFTT